MNIKLSVYLSAKLSNGSLIHSDANEEECKKYINVANILLGTNEVETNSTNIKSLVDIAEMGNKNFINVAKKDYRQLKNAFDGLRKYLRDRNADSNKINFSEFHKKIRNTVILCKQIRKKYHYSYKEIKNKLQEARREPFKYHVPDFINMPDIAKISGMFLFLAYIGGYIYLWALFDLFSFKFYGFFTASDYLLAPLDQIIYALIFLFVMFLISFSKKVDIAGDSKHLKELREYQNKKIIDPLIALVMACFLGFGIFHRNKVELGIGLVIVFNFYGLPLIASRYFRLSKTLIKAVNFLIYFLFYLGIILSRAYAEHAHIINPNTNPEMEILLNNGDTLSNQLFVIKNSEYFFYYNKLNKNITVIPKAQVSSISGIKKN